MRILVIGVLVLGACGGKKDAEPAAGGSAGSSAPGSAAAGPPTPGPGSAATPAATDGTCEAACAHRKACGVPAGGDVDKCTAGCKSLSDTLTADVLSQYSKAPCADVATAETGFRAAMACKGACVHRASCIAEAADQKTCLGDCTALAIVAGESGLKAIDDYVVATCDAVKQQEPDFQAISQCVHTCKHVVECGVEGTIPACIIECAGNLNNKVYGVDTLLSIDKLACEDVKKTVKITAASPAPATGGGSDCQAMCRTIEGCRLASYDACMKDCPTLNPARVGIYAASSCDQLRNPIQTVPALGCMREGRQDCTPGNMCCANGHATRAGQPGQCINPVFCYHRGF